MEDRRARFDAVKRRWWNIMNTCPLSARSYFKKIIAAAVRVKQTSKIVLIMRNITILFQTYSTNEKLLALISIFYKK